MDGLKKYKYKYVYVKTLIIYKYTYSPFKSFLQLMAIMNVLLDCYRKINLNLVI